MSSATNFIIISVLTAINVFVLKQINNQLDSAYMDETFHKDQTTSFYEGDFTYWNPKLTTFPGLFFFSAFIMKILKILDFLKFPMIYNLRGVNVVFGLILSFVFSNFKFYNTEKNTLIFQLILTFLPINYFYNFLFYTDTLSILLIAYYYYLNIGRDESGSKIWKFIVRLFLIFILEHQL